MDFYLLICPVIEWPPGAWVSVSHFFEEVLNDKLAVIGLDDVFC